MLMFFFVWIKLFYFLPILKTQNHFFFQFKLTYKNPYSSARLDQSRGANGSRSYLGIVMLVGVHYISAE